MFTKMKTISIALFLVFSSLSLVATAGNNPKSQTDTVEISAPKQHNWFSLQRQWQHLAHFGELIWPANWFKSRPSASDSCVEELVLDDARRDDLPQFRNTLGLKLKQEKVNSNLSLSWDRSKKPEQLAIYQISGEKLIEFKLAYAGLGEMEVPVDRLKPGKYLIRMQAGSDDAILPFTKK
jgi:hypothetical protein